MTQPQVQIVQSLPQSGRVPRRPTHTWQVRHRPYVLQPFCIHPVLPGETLKEMFFQARVVTDPIKNPIIGWWLDHWWFYVPFSAPPTKWRTDWHLP